MLVTSFGVLTLVFSYVLLQQDVTSFGLLSSGCLLQSLTARRLQVLGLI